MSSTQHQLIEQCATRLRGIVDALDNIHDTSPHRWSTDLDDVHSSAESLLALIKDQAPTQAAQGLAGAALAQPSGEVVVTKNESGAIVSVTRQDKEGRVLSVIAESKPSPAQAEQAEAERPEVVAWRYGFSGGIVSDKACLDEWKSGGEYQSLMTVAQHERIVGALRAKTDQLREALEWRKENQAGQRELLRSVTAERDAALARVAELERGKVYVEARRCDECQHGGINDSATGVAACHECDWTGPEPEEDKCPGCQRENCMAAACPQCGARYVLVASEEIAAPVAQAQHSVPDGAADLCRFLAKLYCELDGLRYSTAKLPAEQIADALIFKWPVLQGARNQLNIKRISEQPYDESKLHSAIAAMLAAAPGKEVPQAWIDVQEERRRQITAEGWTPEHDDEHSHGQMARAAACYALAGSSAPNDGTAALLVSLAWPWDQQWWKPTSARRDLVKACALALAEIERLDRACISQSPQPGATTASS
ncbi:hypothetical protein ACPTIG_01390 [Pseudomonas aeruginosa]|uniref:hypothetical protein n=1 Tax=Pseudomonas aeruginosa TaxID=287 RepID=UPI0022EB426D